MSAALRLLLMAALAVPAAAQDAPPAAPAAEPADDDPDPSDIDPADPDYRIVALPTAVQVADGGWAFLLTHRFARPLGEGDLGDLAGDLFGFDSGAQVGIELRYGLVPRLQLGVHRTSDKTIQLFGLYDVLHAATHPLGVAVLGSVEGLDNLSEEHSAAGGLVVTRRLGGRSSLYAIPMFVSNTNLGDPTDEDDATLVLGLGARLGFAEDWALLAEWAPRITGFRGSNPVTGEENRHHVGFGIERRVGGHAFQINVQDSFGTTPGQIARGGPAGDGWFIGFNLSRRFF